MYFVRNLKFWEPFLHFKIWNVLKIKISFYVIVGLSDIVPNFQPNDMYCGKKKVRRLCVKLAFVFRISKFFFQLAVGLFHIVSKFPLIVYSLWKKMEKTTFSQFFYEPKIKIWNEGWNTYSNLEWSKIIPISENGCKKQKKSLCSAIF